MFPHTSTNTGRSNDESANGIAILPGSYGLHVCPIGSENISRVTTGRHRANRRLNSSDLDMLVNLRSGASTRTTHICIGVSDHSRREADPELGDLELAYCLPPLALDCLKPPGRAVLSAEYN